MITTRTKRWLVVAGFGLWIIFLVKHISVLKGDEIASVDYFSRLREPRDWAESKIVLVLITDDDYKEIFKEGSPLNPSKIIEALGVIASAKPAAIAVDLDTSSSSYSGNIRVEHSIPIVWATEARRETDAPGSHRSFSASDPVVAGTVLGGMYSPSDPWRAGISNLFSDNGVIRRYKWEYDTKAPGPKDSFSLAILRDVCEHSASLKAACGDRKRLPTHCVEPDDPCLRPAFLRFSMSNPPTFSLGDFLKFSPSENAREPVDPAWKEAIAGKIVFVGADYSQSADHYRTVSGQLSGVRIHAEALAAALGEHEVVWPRSRMIVIPAELVALLTLYFVQRRIRNGALRVCVIFFGALFLSALLSLIAFSSAPLFLNFLPLLGGVFLDVLKDVISEAKSMASAH